MKNRLLKEADLQLNSGNNFVVRFDNGVIKWITPKKIYPYNGYTEKEFQKWYSLISKAGFGYKYENERKNVFGNFQKEHRARKENEEEYNLIDKLKNGKELKRRQKEKEYADEH